MTDVGVAAAIFGPGTRITTAAIQVLEAIKGGAAHGTGNMTEKHGAGEAPYFISIIKSKIVVRVAAPGLVLCPARWSGGAS